MGQRGWDKKVKATGKYCFVRNISRVVRKTKGYMETQKALDCQWQNDFRLRFLGHQCHLGKKDACVRQKGTFDTRIKQFLFIWEIFMMQYFWYFTQKRVSLYFC